MSSHKTIAREGRIEFLLFSYCISKEKHAALLLVVCFYLDIVATHGIKGSKLLVTKVLKELTNMLRHGHSKTVANFPRSKKRTKTFLCLYIIENKLFARLEDNQHARDRVLDLPTIRCTTSTEP